MRNTFKYPSSKFSPEREWAASWPHIFTAGESLYVPGQMLPCICSSVSFSSLHVHLDLSSQPISYHRIAPSSPVVTWSSLCEIPIHVGLWRTQSGFPGFLSSALTKELLLWHKFLLWNVMFPFKFFSACAAGGPGRRAVDAHTKGIVSEGLELLHFSPSQRGLGPAGQGEDACSSVYFFLSLK